MSAISKNPIQHWLDTPKGSYYGYPNYGNSLHELLFMNNQDAEHKLGIIIDTIERDLGSLHARTIQQISLLQDAEDKSTSYIVMVLQNGIAIGEFNDV